MKVLITGHTSGIGKAIKDNCPSDYEVRGISRTTGHDIANNLPEVLGFIKEYQPDILFINAWGDGNQNEIATWFVNRFKKGIMITTGSALGYAYLVEGLDGFYDGLIKQPYMHYSDTKAKLLLEAFMWKLRNRQAKDVYWTNYSLGITKTTCGFLSMSSSGDSTEVTQTPFAKPKPS